MIEDRSAKAGFVFRDERSLLRVRSRGPFVGRRSVRIELKEGRWSFSASGGSSRAFTVTG